MTMSNTSPASTWLSLASSEIASSSHLHDELLDVLRAFGKDDGDAPGPATLNPDEQPAANVAVVTHLQDRITTELLDEIDADQASMFGRRFASVSVLLEENTITDSSSGITTNQLLRLALHRRAVQILSTDDPILSKRKALRIRALVDFIWSQSLVLGLKDVSHDNPTLVELVHQKQLQSLSSSRYNELTKGFHHATLEGNTSDYGPVHINILRIQLQKSQCQMKCIDARTINTDLPTLAQQMGAAAAISGGFFLYSEPDIELPSKRTDPVGLLVEDGRILGPPVFRRAAVFQGGDGIGIDKLGMTRVICSFTLQQSDGELSAQQLMELTVGVDNVRCFHRGIAEKVTPSQDEIALKIVGGSLIKWSSEETSIPLAGCVLLLPTTMLPTNWPEKASTDAKINVTYTLPTPLDNAVAGGPIFFDDNNDEQTMDLPSEDFKGSAPPVTFSQDETFDRNLLPRMGIGITNNDSSGEKELVCVAVDGRNLDRALGLTLQGTSDLLKTLGCVKAMNLDGGSSKRMVILDPESSQHSVVCLSTTEIKGNDNDNGGSSKKSAGEPSRPVHSAILFLPPDS
ncbi:predicted protein [Thalassiosira pseudonana CCMP1335]|uniref:Phosphodiester glycosidase domain-containing protein n=1 Tax=Thalassiosira pseudonana TaxID=35128 RepID=B8CD22_THAPS|nr:predicted protein [Thalassiosira pseudonana CCMP1335]EED88532.1 predicted protein [Thalassiosira pseudonana CCMP1335]